MMMMILHVWYDIAIAVVSWTLVISSWSSFRLKRNFYGPLQTLVFSSTWCAHKWVISPLKQYLRYSEQRSDMAALCYICFYDAIFCVYVESSAAEDSCGCHWRVIASRAQMKLSCSFHMFAVFLISRVQNEAPAYCNHPEQLHTAAFLISLMEQTCSLTSFLTLFIYSCCEAATVKTVFVCDGF